MKITFEEIFLFVVRKNRLTVLAPKKGHTCHFSTPDNKAFDLTNHSVNILKNNQLATGTIENNAEPYMVHLDDILGEESYSLKDEAHLAELVTGWFELGGAKCSLEDRPLSKITGDPAYQEFGWSFGAYFTHRLTNRAEFILASAEGYSLEVRERGENKLIYQRNLKNTDEFVACTRDSFREPIYKRYTLKEFGYLYDFLLNRDREAVTGPIPNHPQKETSTERDKRLANRGEIAQDAQNDRDGHVSLACIQPLCPNAVCEIE